MHKITAFRTVDGEQFFNEDAARTHERTYGMLGVIERAVKADPDFARLDRDLLLAFLLKHGAVAAKVALAPIPAQAEPTVQEPAKGDTLGKIIQKTRDEQALDELDRQLDREMADYAR